MNHQHSNATVPQHKKMLQCLEQPLFLGQLRYENIENDHIQLGKPYGASPVIQVKYHWMDVDPQSAEGNQMVKKIMGMLTLNINQAQNTIKLSEMMQSQTWCSSLVYSHDL